MEICKEKRIILHSKKCSFFSKIVKKCGRIVSSDEYSIDQVNLEAKRILDDPQTADGNFELVHCMSWMSLVIPDFTRKVSHLWRR